MPELPEVHTTVTGLQKVLPGLTVKAVWTDMWSTAKLSKNTIKDRGYFPYFKKYVFGKKVIDVRRRAKHILIDLDNGFTLIIHMKMTGHLMVGKWKEKSRKLKVESQKWIPVEKDTPLSDPYNRHIHVMFTFDSGLQMAFSDSRKFGTMVVEKTDLLHEGRFAKIGPEPLETDFTLPVFKERLMKSPLRAVKTVLMDQSIIAGIGNIYSDEMLHRARVLPTRTPESLDETEWKLLYKAMKETLAKGIDFGGDSTSDYRNIEGVRGAFHENHLVYLRTKEKCLTCLRRQVRGRVGVIEKMTIGGRSAHFCRVCQH